MKKLKNGKITFEPCELNFISIALLECAKYYKNNCCQALVKENKDLSDEIYNHLDSIGFYDSVKEK